MKYKHRADIITLSGKAYKARYIGLILFLLLLPPAVLIAQPFGGSGSSPHTIGMEFNARGMASLQVFYAYSLNEDTRLRASAEIPLFLSQASRSMDSFRFEAGADCYIPLYGKAGILTEGSVFFSGQKQVLGRFRTFGVEAALIPGLYGNSGYFGLDAGVRYNVATRLEPSAYVDEAFEQIDSIGPKGRQASGGWMWNPALRFKLGAAGGFGVGKRSFMYVRGGVVFTPSEFDVSFSGFPIGLLPFYMDLGMEYR